MKTLDQLTEYSIELSKTEIIRCKMADILVQYEWINKKWTYTSNDIPLNGEFIGRLGKFKSYLKNEIEKITGKPAQKKHLCYTTIRGTPELIAELKQRAEDSGMSLSQFVFEKCLHPL